MSNKRDLELKDSKHASREVATEERQLHITHEELEKFASITSGPLYISPEEKADPDFVHKWVDASRPARLDKLLDWGAEIVQRRDRHGKMADDVCHDHGDHLVHIKIPRRVQDILDKYADDKRKARQSTKFHADELSETGQAITTINKTF